MAENEEWEQSTSERVREEAKKQAVNAAKRQAARTSKNWLLKIGLAKISLVLAAVVAGLLILLSIFGATYLTALSCTSSNEALLGPGGGVTVGGSVFGGPSDPGTGHRGYQDDDLSSKWKSYAELSTNPSAPIGDLDFKALGVALGSNKKLPYLTALRVTGKRGSLILKKRDVGAGGGDVQGHQRAIDIWYKAGEKLGVGGTFLVKVEAVEGATAEEATDVSFTGGEQSSTKMVRPTSGPVTSPFGQRWGRLHAGLDIAPPAGTPIVAALAGRVDFAGVMSGYGNFICIQHAKRLSTCYGHQQRFAAGIRRNVKVKQGQRIGYVGNTGQSTGPHLHFEVRLGAGFSGTPTDPAPYLEGSKFAEALGEDAAGDDQCVGQNAVNVAVNGNYAWPIGNSSVGKNLIGRPGEGTHSFSAPPNNWQSDNAIDISTRRGDPVVAVDSGTISPTLGFGKLTGDGGSRFAGLRMYLVDSSGNQWYYAHLSRAAVKPGDRVSRGDVIGYSGSANGVEHLHLGVKDGNPLRLLGAK